MRTLTKWVLGIFVAIAMALPMAYIGITEIAARRGIPVAQSELGRWYYEGIWLHPTNKQEAAKWYTKAAESHYVKGQYNLGLLLENKGDYQGAAHWYSLAANQGYPPAQNNLAVLYSEGLGIQKNLHTAFFWYQKAAENGHAIAQYSLGLAYLKGRGVNIDNKKGVYWILQSAKQDNATAQGFLALLYTTGEGGVNVDYIEAKHWAKKALDNGNDQAADTIKIIEQLTQQ